MRDSQKVEVMYRIVGHVGLGQVILALQAVGEIEAAEREECAKIADAISDEAFSIYKGRSPETDTLKRADTYADGYSDGAGAATAAIRARGKA